VAVAPEAGAAEAKLAWMTRLRPAAVMASRPSAPDAGCAECVGHRAVQERGQAYDASIQACRISVAHQTGGRPSQSDAGTGRFLGPCEWHGYLGRVGAPMRREVDE
jgi:hypothetical protein